MKSIARKIVLWCLVLSLTLTGCTGTDFRGYWDQLINIFTGVTPFRQIHYTRPDMDALETQLQTICNQASTETDLET